LKSRVAFWNRITTRVLLLSATVAVLLGTALVILIVAVVAQRDAGRGAYRAQEALTAGSQLEKSLISIENGLRGYVADGRERFLTPAREALRGYPAELERLERLISHEPGQRQRVQRIGESIDDYVNLWARPLLALARERRADAQSVLGTRTGRQRLDVIQADFRTLYARERAVTSERERRAEERSEVAIGVGVLGLAMVLSIAVALALYLRRSVVRPVLAVAGATRRLADGDLSIRVPGDREDEVGELARSFNAMADSLQAGREQLAARSADLERSNAELEQFASITSHDLQAPLVTISMYADLLERKHGSQLDGSRDLLDGIRHSTRQAREQIRDLLEFSRAGRGAPDLEPVPVEEVVSHALEALAGPIEHAGARVVVKPLPTVMADRSNLYRVFQNLIGNAVKFVGDEAPDVIVSARREGREWVFSVRDNGIGMDPEHRERVFGPFQRLHGEEEYPGTGIGLAVCQRIVAQHGGRIWVDTAPGEGSVFSFTLPDSDVVHADGESARPSLEPASRT
jgi:signal transduction histidine kinase